MNHFLITIVPLVLLGIFIAAWRILHRMHRRSLDDHSHAGEALSLEQLSAMKSKLTEEEYRKLRQAVVGRMTRKPERELRLSDLAQELNQMKENRDREPKVPGSDAG